jgi:hypothetical protein
MHIITFQAMENAHIEIGYPLDFRYDETKQLGELLRHRHSVELVGMKRVGISNFLRFFLYKKGIVERYISEKEIHLFIAVDLNDLVDRELYPFWILTFKRIVDTSEQFPLLSDEVKKQLSKLFLDSIQSRDYFLTLENIREAINILIENNTLPTIFFLRFDRIKDAVNPAFFDNLQGLRDSTNQKLAYVFTSNRNVHELSPHALPGNHGTGFTDTLYIKPALTKDARWILETFEKRYQIQLLDEIRDMILTLAGGHVQYLQLSLLALHQELQKTRISLSDLSKYLLSDERVRLQSEEIWESLTLDEQKALQSFNEKSTVTQELHAIGKYIWNTGIINNGNAPKLFSPLFEEYSKKHHITKKDELLDFTKKEYKLYSFLLEHTGELCEREKIIEEVWSEYSDYGVSDWTIDRLVARVRAKLKGQNAKYEIVTIKTRGYKLVEL